MLHKDPYIIAPKTFALIQELQLGHINFLAIYNKHIKLYIAYQWVQFSGFHLFFF